MSKVIRHFFSVLFGLGPVVASVFIAFVVFEASVSIFMYPIAVFTVLCGLRLGLMTYKKSLEMGPWDLYCYIDASPELDNLKPVRDPEDSLLATLIPDDHK